MTGDAPTLLSRRKRWVFAIVVVLFALSAPSVALLATDVYLHRKFERSAGLNIWGYRGPVVHGKRPGEFRVAMFGGSTAFGYGVTWQESMPAVLERDLAGKTAGPISVVNLAYNNEGAYAYAFTMRDYAYLKADLAVLYSGYNDIMADTRSPNLRVFRHDSPIFRLTGYMPIFPLVFKEKAAQILYGGDVDAMYRDARFGTRTVFRPGLATRTTAQILTAAAGVGESLERQLSRVKSDAPEPMADPSSTLCRSPWQWYCAAITTAVELALRNGQQVMVVIQPYEVGPHLRERHVDQQAELTTMIARRFGGDRRVMRVDLGGAIDLSDPTLSFDRMHLTAEGNRRIAADLVAPVLEMRARRMAGSASR